MSVTASRDIQRTAEKWLPEIPASWEMKPLKYLVNFVGGGTPSKENKAFWNGDIPWVSPKDMRQNYIDDTEDHITDEALASAACQLVEPDAVLVVVRSGILKHTIPVAINTVAVTLNQDMKALIPGKRINARYLAYCVAGLQQALLIEWRKAGATVESLEHEYIAGTKWPVPPMSEQQAITTFLDHKTAEIDRLIALKEQQIELLEKKRQAIISEAVTRGLDDRVSFRRTDNSELEYIPVHWQMKRLKFLLSHIEQGWSPQCENRLAEGGEWGVLKVGCVNGKQFNPEEQKALPVDMAPRTEYEIKTGDVLMSRANTRQLLGSAAIVEEVRPRLLLCDKLYRLNVLPHLLDPRYLVLFLRSAWVRAQFERDATGTSDSMQNIGQDTVKELIVPLPPLSEQKMLLLALQEHSNWIDSSVQAIDSSVQAIEQQLSLLRQYRQSLISEAVTGKIDVREQAV